MKLDKQQEAQSAAAGDSISSVGVPVNVKEYTPSEVFTHEAPPVSKFSHFNIRYRNDTLFAVSISEKFTCRFNRVLDIHHLEMRDIGV